MKGLRLIRETPPDTKTKRYSPTQAERATQSHITKRLLYEWSKLYLDREGTLRRNCGAANQIVLPKNLHRTVYSELHEKMGHIGADKVPSLARDSFFWPHMKADIEHFVNNRCRCLKQKKPTLNQREPLKPVLTSEPFEIISIDFLHLERSLSRMITNSKERSGTF